MPCTRGSTRVSGSREVRLGRSRRPSAELIIAIALLATLVGACLGAPWLAPHDPLAPDLAHRLEPPAADAAFPLGTDSLGRDILSRLLYGGRTSLLVGLIAVVLGGGIGTLLGLTCGYFGDWWDALVMRLVDVSQAVPYLVLALAVAVVLGPGIQTAILVLGLATWTTFTRIVRGDALALRDSPVVLAARVLGADDGRILRAHVLPLLAGTLAVTASLMTGSSILFEASLSFLGLGVQRPQPSWGNMLLEGVDVLGVAWWVSFFPGLGILMATLGVNLLGDALRDLLDPRT
jgi:peptide/nickel transport system permease protein